MMFELSSERGLRIWFFLLVGSLAVVAAVFYQLQNSGQLPGGQIAPLKLAWLGCAILFWYVLPALLLLDRRLPAATRLAMKFLLVNMLVRAVVELTMMYATNNWHPSLGIGHDIFSFLIMAALTARALGLGERFHGGYSLVATSMFVPEAIFAWYMLNQVGGPGLTVYFVPDDAAHRPVMLVTAVCVALLIGYLVYFSRRWLYGQAQY